MHAKTWWDTPNYAHIHTSWHVYVALIPATRHLSAVTGFCIVWMNVNSTEQMVSLFSSIFELSIAVTQAKT